MNMKKEKRKVLPFWQFFRSGNIGRPSGQAHENPSGVKRHK